MEKNIDGIFKIFPSWLFWSFSTKLCGFLLKTLKLIFNVLRIPTTIKSQVWIQSIQKHHPSVGQLGKPLIPSVCKTGCHSAFFNPSFNFLADLNDMMVYKCHNNCHKLTPDGNAFNLSNLIQNILEDTLQTNNGLQSKLTLWHQKLLPINIV